MPATLINDYYGRMLHKTVLKNVNEFRRDVKKISELPVLKKDKKLCVSELAFDAQLLALSPLYRASRKKYLALGGAFKPSLCSTMRSLSTHDLFKNEIEYSPVQSEILWLADYIENLPEPDQDLAALRHYSDISVYHEQNHRIFWNLLPPAPNERGALRRYLNFAESLVVTMDIAFGDQVGLALSGSMERLNLLYRPGVDSKIKASSYGPYLLSFFFATYLVLEQVNSRDILKAVNYVLGDELNVNKKAVQRAKELNKQFSEVTNPQWQNLYWLDAYHKLKKLHGTKKQPVLNLPLDPLDIGPSLQLAVRLLGCIPG